VVWAWDGKAWTREKTFGTVNTELNDITCTSTVFCMVGLDTVGDETGAGLRGVGIYNGYSWRVVDGPGIGASGAVSCTFSKFCMEILGSGSKTYWTWNGAAWSARHPLNDLDLDVLTDLDCYSSGLCRAITANGTVEDWNGRAWARHSNSDLHNLLIGIDCPNPTFCALVANNGRAYVSRNGTFGGAVNVGVPFEAVSCASENFCVGVSRTGTSAVYRGPDQGWSAPTTIAAGKILRGVSCPRSFSCHAVSADGYVYRRGSTGWVKTIAVDPVP
jgi:hypothetical protein